MKKNVIKNTIMLYGLSIAKIVFPLITLPYLTRVLAVDTYGVVAYVKSVMQYMQIFVDFGFLLSGTKSIVEVREDKTKLGKVIGNILLARIFLSCIAFICLMVLTMTIPLLRENWIFTILSYIPVFSSIFLFDYLFRGIEQMITITVRFVVMKGLAAILTFAFVKGDMDIIWIPVLDITGSFIAILLVLKSIQKIHIKIKFGNVKDAFKRVGESATYFASNMATTAFGALNTVLIGAFLPTMDVAYWSVCLQIIGAIQTMYNPIIDGIYPEMVKNKDFKLIRKILIIFMPIIFAGSIFSFAIAPIALRIIGGAQYVGAANLFRSLIPVLIFSFPGMILGWTALGSVGKQKQVTISTILTAIFQISGILFLVLNHQFTIINLAILRGLTELFLLVIRSYFLYEYFNHEKRSSKYGKKNCA